VAESFAAGLVGIVLDDRYRLDALIGEGGMGAVFRATQLAMERRVAVKLLKPHLTNDETQLQRFAREARSTLKVDSPHAVKVLDFGVTPHRDYYMVLEYLDGRTVQRDLDIDGPFTPARGVHIARQALHALGTAHQRGLVHRDVKPDNLLLMRVGGDPDYTKVLDFGVAKLMEGAARSDRSALALTQMGMVFGTPEFMSPEQACGHALDGRSDLYSLAATLFAMLTGCGLFDGKSAIEWLTHHARTPPPHLADARPELAAYPELDEVLQRCLAKPRDRRPRDAEELDALFAAIEPTLRRAPGTAAPAGAAAIGIRGPTFSPSSYLNALPTGTVASGEPLVPGAAGPPPAAGPGALAGAALARATTRRPVAETGPQAAEAPPPRRARGLLLALGAIAIVSMVGVARRLALKRRPARQAAATADAGAPDASPPADARAPDAATATGAGAPDAAAPADAAIPPAPLDAGARPPGPAPAPAAKKLQELAEHVQAAKAALREGNRLRYLVESEAAHLADPTHVGARLMYADALIVTGSKERGCAELHAMRRIPAARTRASDAGCPTD
jgi:tRNA A-37 threonylcarbamoyl transferase component Bud32